MVLKITITALISRPPLNVTIFVTHLRNSVNRTYANEACIKRVVVQLPPLTLCGICISGYLAILYSVQHNNNRKIHVDVISNDRLSFL